MGMCASGEISQDKLDKLRGDIERIKTYIDGTVI